MVFYGFFRSFITVFSDTVVTLTVLNNEAFVFTGKGVFLLRILQDVNKRMSFTNKQAVREALIEGNEDKLHL